MSDVVIRVENLGKKYIISHQADRESYSTLRDTLVGKIRSVARRIQGKQQVGSREEFWALKDVNFEIKRGEVMGIIGRNGAGKSTLLKVLSRITEPTTGRVTIDGRVASLLEVGTGFHPELTGRENVYLNGSILGMSRAEVKQKFDEIVAFAEIEKFLDTPVKRYSSGMYMRLAFAVAAHLEPEILIIDEVLAVGDSAFQKKCLGKMGEVAKTGRTVLFVSHDMRAIRRMTQQCLLLGGGTVEYFGDTYSAIVAHEGTSEKGGGPGIYQGKRTGRFNGILEAVVHTSKENGLHEAEQPMTVSFLLQITSDSQGLCFSFNLVNSDNYRCCSFWLFGTDSQFRGRPGIYRLVASLPELRLSMDTYSLTTWFSDVSTGKMLENLDNICQFQIICQTRTRVDYDWQPHEFIYFEKVDWLQEYVRPE